MNSVPGAKIGEVTPGALLLNVVAGVLAVVFLIAAIVAVELTGRSVSPAGFDLVLFLLGMVAVLSLHEVVHALSLFVYAKVPWRGFKFGFNWRQFVFYCHCREPVPLPAFRVFALAPLVVLGTSTLLATVMWPAIWLAAVTALHLAGCIGDVWILLGLRRFPEDCLVLDLPDQIGCAVFRPAPACSGPSSSPNPA